MAFFCDQCGLCCKMLNKIDGMEAFNRGDGVCIYLENNLCSVYPERPNICNSEKMYELIYSKLMSKEEYHHHSFLACQKIKTMFNDLNNWEER